MHVSNTRLNTNYALTYGEFQGHIDHEADREAAIDASISCSYSCIQNNVRKFIKSYFNHSAVSFFVSTKSVSSWSAVAVVLMDVKIKSTHQAPREGFKNVYIANLV